MLVAALVLAFVAFVAFVNFILTSADWSLYVLFAAAGVGLVLFVADSLKKRGREDLGQVDLGEGDDPNAG